MRSDAAWTDAAREGPRALPISEWVAVALGGALGALLRYAIQALATSTAIQPVLGTLAANLIGALALGFIVGRVVHPGSHPLLRPFLVLGFFGSFTTFSSLALESVVLGETASGSLGLLNLAGSMIVGVLFFVAGRRLADVLPDPGGRR